MKKLIFAILVAYSLYMVNQNEPIKEAVQPVNHEPASSTVETVGEDPVQAENMNAAALMLWEEDEDEEAQHIEYIFDAGWEVTGDESFDREDDIEPTPKPTRRPARKPTPKPTEDWPEYIEEEEPEYIEEEEPEYIEEEEPEYIEEEEPEYIEEEEPVYIEEEEPVYIEQEEVMLAPRPEDQETEDAGEKEPPKAQLAPIEMQEQLGSHFPTWESEERPAHNPQPDDEKNERVTWETDEGDWETDEGDWETDEDNWETDEGDWETDEGDWETDEGDWEEDEEDWETEEEDWEADEDDWEADEEPAVSETEAHVHTYVEHVAQAHPHEHYKECTGCGRLVWTEPFDFIPGCDACDAD